MNIRSLLADARRLGGPAGEDAPRLLAHVLQRPVTWLLAHSEHHPDAAERARYHALLARRTAGEPLAHLTGHCSFWTLELEVTPDTLVPRPETELLVETALQLGDARAALRVLDLGTGSGAIALALAAERPRWHITATDASAAALAVARRNAHRLDRPLTLLRGHWFNALPTPQRFHLIVSNPPYVAADDLHLAGDGVRFEPRQALIAGADGLDDLRTIATQAPHHLHPGGWLAVEHGWNQGPAVRALFRNAGFRQVETRRDLAGHPRVTLGRT